VQSLSNPYYLHHLCVQKYFEDDAFVKWCKYLKYFSTPEYLPFLSYVASSSPS
jgi:mediator of RNA polymerase II transcription subunit 31